MAGDYLESVQRHFNLFCQPLYKLRQRDRGAFVHVNCDEVQPRLFLGDRSAVENSVFLREMQFTHLLHAEEVTREKLDELQLFYHKNYSISYQGLPPDEDPNPEIAKYFPMTSQFTEDALLNGGKVLVYCDQGKVKSAATVIAFLMISRRMNAPAAVRSLCMRVKTSLPEDLLEQLVALDETLRLEEHFSWDSKAD